MVLNKHLFCTGDPVIDIFYTGSLTSANRYTTESVERRYGGALNTWKNAEALIGKNTVHFFSPTGPIDANVLYKTEDIYTLRRYLLSLDSKMPSSTHIEASGIPTDKKEFIYTQPQHIDVFMTMKSYYQELLSIHGQIEAALVIADYNKGTVNTHRKAASSIKDIENAFGFCIVDSRNRTLDTSLLKASKFNIWHATGNEYEANFSDNFDMLLWTNGPYDIKIVRAADGVHHELSISIPPVDIIDECGAGDTFTAAVAAYLLYHPANISELSVLNSLELCKDACDFAIACCRDVILQPFTSVTTLTMEDLCTSLISKKSSHFSEDSLENT